MRKFKKVIWIAILIIVIGAMIYGINKTKTTAQLSDNTTTTTSGTNKKVKKVVIGDNFFITQLNDIYYNANEYIGREIEIEGFPLSDGQYKFVGRYGPGCCTGDGYAFFEYESDQELQLTDEKDWIKVIGILKKGIDDKGKEYLYIDATSVEKMETRGMDTVTT